jgi:hypothetical protein
MVSNEAMTMLILKHNIDKWSKMVDLAEMGEENVKMEKCLAKQLYFEVGKGEDNLGMYRVKRIKMKSIIRFV